MNLYQKCPNLFHRSRRSSELKGEPDAWVGGVKKGAFNVLVLLPLTH